MCWTKTPTSWARCIYVIRTTWSNNTVLEKFETSLDQQVDAFGTLWYNSRQCTHRSFIETKPTHAWKKCINAYWEIVNVNKISLTLNDLFSLTVILGSLIIWPLFTTVPPVSISKPLHCVVFNFPDRFTYGMLGLYLLPLWFSDRAPNTYPLPLWFSNLVSPTSYLLLQLSFSDPALKHICFTIVGLRSCFTHSYPLRLWFWGRASPTRFSLWLCCSDRASLMPHPLWVWCQDRFTHAILLEEWYRIRFVKAAWFYWTSTEGICMFW